MKRGKKLIILSFVLIIMAVLVYLMKHASTNEDGFEQEKPAEKMISISENEIVSLSWNAEGEELSFVRIGDEWVKTDDSEFPVNSHILNGMAYSLSTIYPTRVIETPENIAEYGLDNPSLTVVINDNITVNFGIVSEISGNYYMSIGDGKVYLAYCGVVSDFERGINAVIKSEEIPLITNISSVSVNGQNKDVLIEYIDDPEVSGYEDYVWFYVDEEEGYLPLDTEKALNYISNAINLDFIQCKNYNASEEDIIEYRLDDPYVSVTVTYEGGEFGYDIGSLDNNDTSMLVRIHGSNMVYNIDNMVIMNLLYTNYSDMQPEEY